MSSDTTQRIEPSAPSPDQAASKVSTALLRSALGCVDRSMLGPSSRESSILSPTKVALSLVNPFQNFTSLSKIAEAISGGWHVIILFDKDLPLRLEQLEDVRRSVYDHMFGTPEWRTVASLGREDRGRYALELYKAQLSIRCPLASIRSFSLMDGIRLVIASSTVDGIGWLKSTMWRLSGDPEIVDDTDTNHTIKISHFDDASWRTALRRNLQSRFSGRTIDSEVIRDHILMATPYPFDQAMLERMVENRFIKRVEDQGGRVIYRFPLGK
jgi:hypothetical protein